MRKKIERVVTCDDVGVFPMCEAFDSLSFVKGRMSRKKLEDRLAEVERLLAEGHPPTAAARAASERYGVGLRQGQRYVARVFERWQQNDSVMRAHRRDLVRYSAQHLYHECFEREQWQDCAKILTLLCKIDGVYGQHAEVHRSEQGE